MNPRVMICSLALLGCTSCSLFWKAVRDPDVIKEAGELVEEIVKADGV